MNYSNTDTQESQNTLNEPDFNYSGLYTYADYMRWTIEERVELIKGKIFRMSPAPMNIHQSAVGNVFGILWTYLKGKTCEVRTAPYDVRLYRKSKKDEDILTVVQPDVCVICDPAKIDVRGCIGAPDIVVEVLSHSNTKKELKNKYEVYEESGVKEYWLVHPSDKTLFRYILGINGKYTPDALYASDDIITTSVLPGLELKLEEVFDYIV